MTKIWMNKEDWNKLDALLGKHGFGGYYDLVECLKIVLGRVGKGKLKDDWENKTKDLYAVVHLLLNVTKET